MSPCFIRNLAPNGLQPVDYAADSLAEAAAHETDDGVYTVTNTYHTYQTLKLNDHLDRLEDSAHQSGIPLALERTHLRAALRAMIDEAGYGDVRFRITVPRRADYLVISMEPFTPLSPEFIAEGVRCATVPDRARNNPTVKVTRWMRTRSEIHDSLGQDVYEVILLDADGYLLEGMSSNFYALLNGELRTAGKGVLAGIARQVVFEVAPETLLVRLEPAHVRDIPRVEEVFITSSSRGVVPVVEIDSYTIGGGKPGEKTMSLRDAYSIWVNEHLEDL